MSHYKSLARIVTACRGMTLKDVDADLVVYHCGNPHIAIMYQAARNLDAESKRQADADPVLRDVLG